MDEKLSNSTIASTPMEREPRSASAVLGVVGAIVALPILVVLLFFIISDSTADSANGALEGVRASRVQSVELTNGRILYGRLEQSAGEWIVLRDAYALRRADSDTAADAGTKDAAGDGAQLVPVAAEQGGDGDVFINARELVSFQNLTASSDIGSRIEDATK